MLVRNNKTCNVVTHISNTSKTYDIFTDASIDHGTNIGCAGVICIDRETNKTIFHKYMLHKESSNNKSELIGISEGVNIAADILLNRVSKPFNVNIFSDSKISILGIREWIFSWILNQTPEGVFINSSRSIVANQEFFRAIFNTITSIGLKVNFYHQKGHVSLNSPDSILNSKKVFYESNHRTIDSLGIDPEYLALYNNLVDQTSRSLIKEYQSGELHESCAYDSIPIVRLYRENPMVYYCKKDLIDSYAALLKGGINYPLCQY